MSFDMEKYVLQEKLDRELELKEYKRLMQLAKKINKETYFKFYVRFNDKKTTYLTLKINENKYKLTVQASEKHNTCILQIIDSDGYEVSFTSNCNKTIENPVDLFEKLGFSEKEYEKSKMLKEI